MTARKLLCAAFVAFVFAVLYFHLLAGILLAIAAAFYYLLERRLPRPIQSIPPAERLRCVRGHHYIGNEPYTFIADGCSDEGEPVCLRCLQRNLKSLDERIQEIDEQVAREIEWESLTEEEREARRAVAEICGTCPRCRKTLHTDDSDTHSKGSCPMCHEFPFNIRAPMNRGWREKEWASLSESEKQRRFDAAVKKSGWAKGNDGVWRRGDETIDEGHLIDMAKGRWGDPLVEKNE